MSKFQTNDVVQYKNKPGINYIVIRVFKSNDGTSKYDIQSLDGATLIISNPEKVLEKVVK